MTAVQKSAFGGRYSNTLRQKHAYAAGKSVQRNATRGLFLRRFRKNAPSFLLLLV